MLNQLKYHLLNSFGTRTKRKIVVFESDDWGNERLRDKSTYEIALKKGMIDRNPYFKFDALESNRDLDRLFDLFSAFKDSKGKPPKIAANFIVANPDYEKIEAANFEQFYYETTPITLDRYQNHDQVLQLYKTGISDDFFKPQYHGREHLDVDRWMKALKAKDPRAVFAFKHRFVNISSAKENKTRDGITAAFDYERLEVLEGFRLVIQDMKKLFFDLFEQNSTSFIAPAYTWNKKMEPYLAEIGVKYLQTVWQQTSPEPGSSKRYKRINHYCGQSNGLGQKYLVRNAFFEPAINGHFDWVDNAMKRIEVAFFHQKPAIISTHRLNFMGTHFPENRDKNLVLLERLLTRILEHWPSVEFMSTDELGDTILSD